jgi:hypothetical protein
MKFRRFSDWPLQWKVMTWITFAQLTMSIAVFYAVLNQSDNALKVSAEAGFRELDTVMATALVDPLLHRDDALLQRLADELFKSKAVEGIQIVGPSGSVLAQSGKTSHSATKRPDVASSVDSFVWGTSSTIHKTRLNSQGNHSAMLIIRFQSPHN